ncbi:MAG: hypothetical protein H6R07_425 [Proteobacteria bacterium]|nr:hypothetical protein [Pseudomonadota bacterium]
MKAGNMLLMAALAGLLASGEAALAAVHNPLRHRSVVSPARASGKVLTLPASLLPKEAIVPGAAAKGTAPVSARREVEAVQVTTDPNVRWQLYSYP